MTKPRSRPKSWPAPRASPLSLQHDSDDSFSDGVSELSSSENEDLHTMPAFPDIVKGKGKEETGKLGQKILPAEILETYGIARVLEFMSVLIALLVYYTLLTLIHLPLLSSSTTPGEKRRKRPTSTLISSQDANPMP